MHKRKHIKRRIILVLMALLIVHIILVLIKIPSRIVSFDEVEIPYNYIENYTFIHNISEQECVDKKFKWDYRWGGWLPEKNSSISPIYNLINLEKRPGQFRVQFAFFDESVHPFSNYQNKDYELVKYDLPWDMASMHSPILSFNIGPEEKITITEYVAKKDSEGVYWTYADVIPPIYKECFNKTFVYEEQMSEIVTKYETIEEKKEEIIGISLLDYILGFFFKKMNGHGRTFVTDCEPNGEHVQSCIALTCQPSVTSCFEPPTFSLEGFSA